MNTQLVVTMTTSPYWIATLAFLYIPFLILSVFAFAILSLRVGFLAIAWGTVLNVLWLLFIGTLTIGGFAEEFGHHFVMWGIALIVGFLFGGSMRFFRWLDARPQSVASPGAV